MCVHTYLYTVHSFKPFKRHFHQHNPLLIQLFLGFVDLKAVQACAACAVSKILIHSGVPLALR